MAAVTAQQYEDQGLHPDDLALYDVLVGSVGIHEGRLAVGTSKPADKRPKRSFVSTATGEEGRSSGEGAGARSRDVGFGTCHWRPRSHTNRICGSGRACSAWLYGIGCSCAYPTANVFGEKSTHTKTTV